MMTRGSNEKRKEWDRKYYEKLCEDKGKMEERRKKQKEIRKRKRIEESLLYDAQGEQGEKVKRLRKSKEKLRRELEESREIEVQDMVEPQQYAEPQEEEEVLDEESEKCSWEKMEKAGNFMMNDEEDIPRYTSLDLPTFNGLVEESAQNLKMTTFRGSVRKKEDTATVIPTRIFHLHDTCVASFLSNN